MLRRDFAKALIAAGVSVAAPLAAGESDALVLEDVRRLTIKPGDVITLSVDGTVSAETAEKLRAHMKGVFPDNKVLVLERLKIGIVGSDA